MLLLVQQSVLLHMVTTGQALRSRVDETCISDFNGVAVKEVHHLKAAALNTFGEDKLCFAHIFDEMFWLPEPASTLALVASGFALRTVVSASDKCVLCSESNEKCSLN